jgi:hypothetical protein
MAKVSQRQQQRNRSNLRWGAIALLAAFSVLGAAGYYMVTKEAPLDAATLCPADGPSGHYVLLVDKTDPLNFTQKYAFVTVLHDLIEKRVPKGFLLSVFVLGEDYTETAEPLIELCNPGSDEGKNKFTANLERLRMQYEERFLKPLLEKTDDLVAVEPSKTSPIFEMIQLVGINAFRKHDVAGERRLVIMSDMLHNTPQFSMYRDKQEFQPFADSDYGRKAHAELRGVEVEIHYLINTPRLQTKRNLKFWEDYFSASGARIVKVTPLEG